jgi:hypothetical protein
LPPKRQERASFSINKDCAPIMMLLLNPFRRIP